MSLNKRQRKTHISRHDDDDDKDIVRVRKICKTNFKERHDNAF